MSVFEHPEFRGHEEIAFFNDVASGLRAIIAIHSTAMGAVAGGGIRMRVYANEAQALGDVLRLSRGMTYKSALAGIRLGGAKSVIIGDPAKDKSPALFAAMARAIESFGGRYYAGEDVGTTTADMNEIAKTTRYVAAGDGPDTAPYTADGVYHAMRVAISRKLGREDFNGVRVALQGVGKVAQRLGARLAKEGARIVAADIDAEALARAVGDFGATAVGVDEILEEDVDVLAPCALGGVLNERTIPRIKAKIVCGAANNQLGTDLDDARLADRGILYMPDYLVNAGGVIVGAAAALDGVQDADELSARVARIAETAERVIEKSERENIGTARAADRLAEKIIAEKKRQ
ncbi:MAG TPA: Glu/Leu/Phe/Val dehydrogenase dimerization domain-containing protein [Parvularculaceae bacterium]|nr:Glu/Leu/Phe/Val dehydrogenase dimerization domain-containing protein [Parvularculaceae bacterium]